MADPAIRLNRLLDLLPRVFTADVRGSVIGTVLRTMAASLTRLDDDMARVLRDRWIGLASGWRRTDEDEVRLRDLAYHLGPDGAALLAAIGQDMKAPLAALRETAAAMQDLDARRARLGVLAELDRVAALWQADEGEPSALERLGQLVGVPRLMPRAGPREPMEDYRQRIQITARALSRGLATPRAILSLAIADLGLEPCPRMETVASRATAPGEWATEATVAWGVKLGTRRRCPVCDGGSDAPCPNRDQRAVDAWVSENPVREALHREARLSPWQDFVINSLTLVADRPRIVLRVLEGRLEFPALQNRATGEIMLFAGTLRTDEELQVDPELVRPDETLPFDSHDDTPHHEWLSAHPAGRAQVVDHAQDTVRDATGLVFFIYGSRFIDPASGSFDAVFDGTHFSDITRRARTPLLRHGQDTWRLMSMPNPAAEFDADTSRYAGDGEAGTRFAKWDSEITDLGAAAQNLFAELVAAERAPVTGGVSVALELRWFTRPPHMVRLSIPRSVAVEAAEARGAIDLLLADVAQARAAGVRVLVNFPQPRWRDEHPVSDRFTARAALRLHEAASVTEKPPAFQPVVTLRDTHVVREGSPRFGGRLDVTRFDASVLA